MSCRITLAGNVVFDRVNSATVNESIKKLSDTATLILPREFKEAIVEGRTESIARRNITDFIKVGDTVKIELGYDNNLNTEFEGYIKSIGADVPLVLECEDEMYKLRKTNFVKSYSSIGLAQLVTGIAPGYKTDLIDDVGLGKFVINNASAYEVLEDLRKNYGLHSRFKDGVLVIGFPVSIVPGVVHQINMNRNVRALSTDLKFVRKEDYKLLLKAISINKDGTRFRTEFGDKGGATRTLHFTNKSLKELEVLTENNFKSLSFDGYQGTIPTWGLPLTKAGDAIEVTDPNYENSERDGKYLIEGVVKKFNSNDGFVRENKIGLKL